MTNWYASPNLSDTEGLFTYFKYVNNTLSDGLFFPVMLLVIWVISFVATFSVTGQDKTAAAKGVVFASFFAAVLGVPLSIMGMLNPVYMYLPGILLATGLLILYLQRSNID